MSIPSRKRIQRKNPWQPNPAPEILQTRGFSNGVKARESRLPSTSDILQTRPFAPQVQKVEAPPPPSPEQIEAAERFGYNGANIPAFEPSTPPPVVQREEVTEEDTSEESEKEEQPLGLGLPEESEKPQEVSPPQSGTIQLKCDECGAKDSAEKLPETIQTQAEISEVKDYTQNRFSSIRGDKETYIWQPKSIGKLDTKLLARNQQQGLSITQAKPSRIRAKKVDELVGKKETLSKPEVANPTEEVAATGEQKLPIQGKLTIGEAGDKYEQEADAVAAQVVDKINAPQPQESVQRQSELGVTSVPNITVMRHSESGTGEGKSVNMVGAEFRYNGVSIPSFSPSTESPTVQLQEDTEEESAAQIEEHQPGWESGGELSKPQSVEVSHQSGTIQRQCDECGAKKEGEKLQETIQNQNEILLAQETGNILRDAGSGLWVLITALGTWTFSTFAEARQKLRELSEQSGDKKPTNSLEIPWKERDTWPKNCQLSTQVPGSPDSEYDICSYICRDWGLKDSIRRQILKGGKCPQWLDWVPDIIPNE